MCLCASTTSTAVSAPATEIHRPSTANHCILIATLPRLAAAPVIIPQAQPDLSGPRGHGVHRRSGGGRIADRETPQATALARVVELGQTQFVQRDFLRIGPAH